MFGGLALPGVASEKVAKQKLNVYVYSIYSESVQLASSCYLITFWLNHWCWWHWQSVANRVFIDRMQLSFVGFFVYLLYSDTVKELFISDLLLEESKLKTFEQVWNSVVIMHCKDALFLSMLNWTLFLEFVESCGQFLAICLTIWVWHVFVPLFVVVCMSFVLSQLLWSDIYW